MKILDVRWFCGRNNTGIVRVEDKYDGIKYYIAGIEGCDEKQDMQFIANYGTPFPNDAGDVLFGVE